MPQFLNHYIFHGHNKIHYTEMKELYISLSLRALALGVGGLFVPLYLYDIGYSIQAIAVFYIFGMVARLPLELVAGKLVCWVGVKHTITLSYLSLFLHFIVLYWIQFTPWLWPLAALLLAMEMSFFWVSYHLHVSNVRNKQKASSQIGITIMLRRLFMALGPLAGGLVAAFYGVEFTLLVAAVLLLLAAYPLFKTADLRWHQDFRIRDLSFSFGRDTIAHFAWQISGVVATYLWPLWLLFVLGSYSQIGAVLALSIIVGIGLTLWVGKMGDKGHNEQLLKFGSGVKSLSHGLRVVSDGFGLAFTANAFNDLGDNLVQGPFTERFYEAADRKERFLYILRMNIVSVLGKSLGWIILLILTVELAGLTALQVMFMIAAISMPAITWVSKRNFN